MTQREKYNISEQRLKIFDRDNWLCMVCGEPILLYGTPQLAHKIKQSKYYLEKYGEHIIHHEDNMLSVCSLECNSKVDLGSDQKQIDELAQRIRYQVEMELLTKDGWV